MVDGTTEGSRHSLGARRSGFLRENPRVETGGSDLGNRQEPANEIPSTPVDE